MKMIARLAGTAAVLATMLLVAWPGAASAAADGGLGLDLRTAQPSFAQDELIRLTLAVTNGTGAECGLAKAAEGTVQVLSVRKDGQELFPVLGRSFYLDGIDNAIADSTASAAPGATVDVALTSVRVHDGDAPGSVVVRSVTASPDGGGLDALWPVGATGDYELTAAYAIPAIGGAVTPCSGGTVMRTVKFTVGEPKGGIPWLWIGAGVGVLVLIVLVVVVLLRKRKPAAAVAVALVLLGLSAVFSTPGRPAYADVEIDPTRGIPVPNFQPQVEACLAGFAKPGNDPSGLLPRLKDKSTPKVSIIPTTGESQAFETPQGPGGKGSSSVAWNPTNTDDYGDGVLRDPCASLYHELNHADDISKNQVPEGDCGDTGIKKAEVKATLAENRYRQAQNPKLDARKEYKGNVLPPSYDECKKPTKPKPPQKGPVRLCEGTTGGDCASNNGDPHMITFDRVFYDFQAVGEFVVIRSTGGDALEVQSRQAAMGPSRTVSVNSALAFRLGDHRVSLVIANAVTEVRIDGEPATLARGEKSLPGGGTLVRRESDLRTADGYDIRWPDGSEAAVDQIGSYGYRLLVKLAKSRSGKVQGLLGNFDGDPDNDIAPPTGAALTQPVPFEKLYPGYADSWRLTQEASLFTYASGQSTQTFTDKAFPDKPVTLEDLDAARRAQAEEICRWAGLSSGWQFLECVFDVAATGRSEFAASSASTGRVAPAPSPIKEKPIASGTLTAGTDEKLTFAGHTGDQVFVDVTGPTMSNECSPYVLLDPTGKEIASGCNINGVGYIDRTELTMDGQYSVTIKTRESANARANMRVYLAKDTVAAIKPNGDPVTAVIAQPGAEARYTFTGAAGQRVYVAVPASTLPNQCSPLELHDRTGKTLASGCVINGVGEIDGTLLPEDGTYTVVVDPNDRTIGSTDLQLFTAKDQTAEIALNGQPVVANVTQPGLVLRYRFTGTAGSSVTLTATDSTLPDQCSPLELLDPAGKLFASGCVINGSGGIAATVLPSTGTYTIVVDANVAAIGVATLTLRSS
ncbi:hypothetical protein F4553_001103 [Allocatelliglobosispora scoriae]|uniref:VWFD domain-containing protein n=1 Tax=Allocatelliglobosispora scoriae TaxID=643052 RepID=A0A841BHG0_9ACTN|nr:VWD domain-containing protein [Allocatelliglobosispora scoriae]MBB5867724.1 hypothetical protein [Allocatelliglobosispora scoriae]